DSTVAFSPCVVAAAGLTAKPERAMDIRSPKNRIRRAPNLASLRLGLRLHDYTVEREMTAHEPLEHLVSSILVRCMEDWIKDLSLGMQVLGTWCERVPQILLIC